VITGVVTAKREATIPFSVRGPTGQMTEIESVIDTGFTGLLTLPIAIVRSLDLPWRGQAQAMLGDSTTSPIRRLFSDGNLGRYGAACGSGCRRSNSACRDGVALWS